jgi:O-antigen/teichoic acid export membrane protein
VITGRLLARNSALNLAGQLVPMVVGIVAIPILISQMGSDRFGILTLAYAIIGYFGLFDFGIGRALTQAVGEALGREDHGALASLTGAALPAMFVLGAVGGLIIAAASHRLIYGWLNMPTALRPEALRAFYVLAVSLPFLVLTTGYRGLLEAHQHFGLATALRLPFSVFSYAGPLLALPFSRSLVPVIAVLAGGRIAACLVHAVFCHRRYAFLRGVRGAHIRDLLPLLRIGGWMTASNIISPVMVNLDRFLIGALLTTTAVAFYTAPYDAVTKFLLVPGAIMGVFFPAFATLHQMDRAGTTRLFDGATRIIMLVGFPVLLVTVAFSHTILGLWIGPEYARASTRLLQVLAVGVYLSCFAQVPFALVQAVGRPDLTAKLHLIELPCYVVLIFTLSHAFGLLGFALAFTGRVALDGAALYWFAGRQMPNGRRLVARWSAAAAVTAGVLACAALPGATAGRVLFVSAVLVAFAWIAWRWLVLPEERGIAARFLPRLRPRPARAA